MRLLLVTNDYPPKLGGIQNYLANLVDRYPDPVRVLAPRSSGAPADLRVGRGRWGFMLPRRRVADWIEAEARDFAAEFILFGAPSPLPWLGGRLRERLGIPFGIVAHGAELSIPAAVPGFRRLVVGPLRDADVVFTNSRFTTGVVERLRGRPVTYLGVGIDLERFHPPPQPVTTRLVGCVSRLVPRKGQAELIRATASLRRSGSQAALLVVGSGRTLSQLRRLAHKLGVHARFEVGVADAVLPDLYREMAAFAMPCRSRWFGLEAEGLGIVFLEAAASGLPVIAGNSGGAPETVIPGTTGFVVGNQRELEVALDSLLSDPERAQAMGKAGRAFMEEQFSWEKVMQRLASGLSSGN